MRRSLPSRSPPPTPSPTVAKEVPDVSKRLFSVYFKKFDLSNHFTRTDLSTAAMGIDAAGEAGEAGEAGAAEAGVLGAADARGERDLERRRRGGIAKPSNKKKIFKNLNQMLKLSFKSKT